MARIMALRELSPTVEYLMTEFNEICIDMLSSLYS